MAKVNKEEKALRRRGEKVSVVKVVIFSKDEKKGIFLGENREWLRGGYKYKNVAREVR